MPSGGISTRTYRHEFLMIVHTTVQFYCSNLVTDKLVDIPPQDMCIFTEGDLRELASKAGMNMLSRRKLINAVEKIRKDA